ncbi:hypothetical protein [Phyllobacterium chamaecytisi]|uniref:hypothetical protein n=1 Tax=Phyllobacterium chamaecytisi TaxID=2876082 RepID=UPI001CCC04F5|nr:hypothetical protein [Phyllobacterium sp. KW56]MBZ9603188.1 hypothetical protein [Phyllobacterium sp. KW56]
MKKTIKRVVGASDGHVLGDRAFAAITAVEGIRLSETSRERLASMKTRKLTAEEQRTEVIRAYVEAKSR